MDINATLFVQIIVFIVFIGVTLKYIWPPVIKAMQDREKKIAEGLEAGERGKQRLETAKNRTVEMVKTAKQEAVKIMEQAGTKAVQIIDEAKETGIKESQRIVAHAQAEINQRVQQAKETLRLSLVDLIVEGAEKIMLKEVDKKTHEQLFNQLIAELK